MKNTKSNLTMLPFEYGFNACSYKHLEQKVGVWGRKPHPHIPHYKPPLCSLTVGTSTREEAD